MSKDEQHCKKCDIQMEEKAALPSQEGDYQPYLFQCPTCKNVEILWR